MYRILLVIKEVLQVDVELCKHQSVQVEDCEQHLLLFSQKLCGVETVVKLKLREE